MAANESDLLLNDKELLALPCEFLASNAHNNIVVNETDHISLVHENTVLLIKEIIIV